MNNFRINDLKVGMLVSAKPASGHEIDGRILELDARLNRVRLDDGNGPDAGTWVAVDRVFHIINLKR